MRSKDFRRVYDHGAKFAGPLFAAFYLRAEDGGAAGARVGFTTPRALGGAVIRNRIKRRLREVVRQVLPGAGPFDIVFNPRRRALDAPLAEIEREVNKFLSRCVR